MATLHARSSCCGAQVHRFGGRRRSCSCCGRTWSVRRRRRGPAARRITERLPEAVLLEKVPVDLLARRSHRSTATIRRRLGRALEKIAAEPFVPTVTAGGLVLLIDGLWSKLRGRRWVLYNMALKPAASHTAWFLRPHLRAGHESMRGWEAALNTIPCELAGRICALAADGKTGIDILAQSRGWPLQLCHRHLIAALDRKLGHPRRQRTVQRPGRDIRATILELLATSDESRVAEACQEIQHLCGHPNCTVGLRAVALHFVRHQREYRTYLLQPDLGIPTTTCTLESMHNLLRRAISTVNDPASLFRRAAAFLQLHPAITCHGPRLQQK